MKLAILLVIGALLATLFGIIFCYRNKEISIFPPTITQVVWSSPNYRDANTSVELRDSDYFNIIMIATLSDGQKINSEPILVQVFILGDGGIFIKESKPSQREITLYRGESWVTTVDFKEYGKIESMIFKYLYQEIDCINMEILNN